MKKELDNWSYNWNDVESIEDVPEDAIGFVYLIETSNGRYYVGKKNLYTTRKKKFGKKKLATITDKRVKKYEMITKESDWLTYTGSNKELNEDIKNGVTIHRVIEAFAKTKAELTYLEVKYQFYYEVLEHEDAYNDSILGKFYKFK